MCGRMATIVALGQSHTSTFIKEKAAHDIRRYIIVQSCTLLKERTNTPRETIEILAHVSQSGAHSMLLSWKDGGAHQPHRHEKMAADVQKGEGRAQPGRLILGFKPSIRD